jgi:hypothetical protein
MKLLEENVGVSLHDHGFGNGFLDIVPKAQATKQSKGKIGFSKIKHFVHLIKK